MLNLDHFVGDCLSAVRADPSHKSVAEVVKRAMRDPAAVLAALGEPVKSGITPLFKSPELTILNLVWKPSMTVMPHNHEMWAVIGIYNGREDNIFWRRIRDDPDGRIEAAGAHAMCTGDVMPMGRDIIHSVTNPIPKLSAAIHVYGGDFFEAERSEWDAEHLAERPLDIERVKAQFAES